MNDFNRARFKAVLAIAMLAGAAYFTWPASASLITAQLAQSSDQKGQVEFFEKQVRPILVANCARCHNAKAKVADLDLTTAEGFTRGGESGALVDKERWEESRVVKTIGYNDKLKMPPSGKLKDEELAVLTAWIKMGAPWPNAKLEVVAEAKAAAKTTVREFTAEEKAFWAFQPMAHVTPPSVKNSAWVKSPIDAFLLRKLEEKGIAPAAPADKLTLLRRASFDLTGLPPSEKEIGEFLNDQSPDAFKKVVERLFSSPAYGERWGRHWLDVARYADSTGNDEDHRYPHAWRYRDYVIEAFNNDLPYDQFIREQIAGDLLPAKDGQEVNRRGIIATGFLALGPKAIAQQDKRKMLYDVYDEQVDVTSRAFLGLTVSCARCHNHKFDPILTRDYYSMAGIFASTKSFSEPMAFVSQSLYKPIVPKADYDVYLAKKNANKDQLKRREIATADITDAAKARLMAEHGSRLGDYMLAARSVYQDQADLKATAAKQRLAEDVLKRWVEYLKPGKIKQHLLEWSNAAPDRLNAVAAGYQQRFQDRLLKWNEDLKKWREKRAAAVKDNKPLPDRPTFEAGLDRFFSEVWFGKEGAFNVSTDDQAKFREEENAQLAQLKKQSQEIKKQAPTEPEMACAVEEDQIVNQKVFIRGDHHIEGEDAPKAIPAILIPRTSQIEVKEGSGRLELAKWLTQAEHPLTARVMANRVWQWHFGEGLVRTPDNFGKMGERPTHPELLDFLARRLVESGWSIKALHRLVMNSSAYQMSSSASEAAFAVDPEDKLLSRFNRRRMSVEEMRDALLSVDGSLDCAIGGALQNGSGPDSENGNGRLSVNPEKPNRRTVYLPLRRANLPTLLNLFDFGDATTPSGKRQLTNVATQALFWMNSEFLSDRSKAIAKSVLDRRDLNDEARVKMLYLKVINQEAAAEDLSQALNYLSALKQKYSKDDLSAWQSLCRALMASNDFVYID